MMILDATISIIKRDKEVPKPLVKELCIFISNYTSATKTMLCRYLQKSGVCNAKISNMSTSELIVNFKKQVSKDTKAPCFISTELQLITFSMRNKLSHNLNQVDYLAKVIEDSSIKKFLNFLTKLSTESKEIENLLKKKVEIKEEIKEEKAIEKDIYHFGIKV